MEIALIGAGRLGTSLARRFAGLGHSVDVRVPDPSDEKHAALSQLDGIALNAAGTPLGSADIIFLAVPWEVATDVTSALGDLGGRSLVDCTNPVTFGADGLALAVGHTTSGAEMIAEAAKNATVFKTLNQLGTPILDAPEDFAAPPLMYVAGPDGDEKEQLMGLIAELGLDPHDAGPLAAARLLEPLALLWMSQAFRPDGGPNFTHVWQNRP